MRMYFFGILAFFSLALNANNAIDSMPNQADLHEAKVSQVAAKQNVGQETYDHFCITCHQAGVAGAPKFGVQDDWKPRLVGRTLDDLVASAVKGLNAMPAQGTCTECSEEDLRAAIDYMMPKP